MVMKLRFIKLLFVACLVLFNSQLNAQNEKNFLVVVSNRINKDNKTLINFQIILNQREAVELTNTYFINTKSKIADIKKIADMIGQEATNEDRLIFYMDVDESLQQTQEPLTANDLYAFSQKIWCNQQLFVFKDSNHQITSKFIQHLTKNIDESFLMNANRVVLAFDNNNPTDDFFKNYHHIEALKILPLWNDAKKNHKEVELWKLALKTASSFIDPFYWSEKVQTTKWYEMTVAEQKFRDDLERKKIEKLQKEYGVAPPPPPPPSSNAENSKNNSIKKPPIKNNSKKPTMSATPPTAEVPVRGSQPQSVPKPKLLIEKGETLCLIVGINEFKSFNPLKNPINDAKKVKEIIDNQYRFRTLLLENPIYKEFRSTLFKIREDYAFAEGSQFLLFVASHGAKDENNEGQIIFKDSYTDDGFLKNVYALNSLKKAISQFNCINTLMLIDICHSGTMFDDGSCNKPNPMVIPLNSPIFASNSPQSPAFKNFLNQRTNIFMGSSLDQEASDGTTNHSPFAQSVIDFLSENKLPVIDSYYLEQKITHKSLEYGAISLPMFCSFNGASDGRFLFIKK